MSEEFEKVAPSEFYLTIGGKKRQVRFGNLALAKVEERYGSVTDFEKLQAELETKPMTTIPWLLSICLKDKEGLGETAEDILSVMDDDNLSIKDVMEVVSQAMENSMSNMFGADGKKKTMRTKK